MRDVTLTMIIVLNNNHAETSYIVFSGYLTESRVVIVDCYQNLWVNHN